MMWGMMREGPEKMSGLPFVKQPGSNPSRNKARSVCTPKAHGFNHSTRMPFKVLKKS